MFLMLPIFLSATFLLGNAMRKGWEKLGGGFGGWVLIAVGCTVAAGAPFLVYNILLTSVFALLGLMYGFSEGRQDEMPLPSRTGLYMLQWLPTVTVMLSSVIWLFKC